MKYLILCAALSPILFFLSGYYFLSRRSSGRVISIFWIMAAALLFRLLTGILYRGFSVDINCFTYWADRMFQYGPGHFYTSEVFCDYPPGYLYILYPIGMLRHFLKLSADSMLSCLLVKLPAICCDLGTGYLLYRHALRNCGRKPAEFLTILYLFQPAVWVNSALWGQVDSVFTFFLVCMCICLMEEKLFGSYLAFGIGILLKPQMLVFTPVLLLGILEKVFLTDFSFSKVIKNLFQGMSVIAGMVLFCLPFGLSDCIRQYQSTLGSYPYASVNAYNFWSMLGLNWADQDTPFAFLTCHTWGSVVIVLLVLLTFFFGLRMGKGKWKYPLLSAFLIVNLFIFSVRMHERYMYPGLILFLLAYVHLRDKRILYLFQGFALTQVLNVLHVLFFYDPSNYSATSAIRSIISLATVACTVYMNHIVVTLFFHKKVPASTPLAGTTPKKLLTRLDWFLLAGILVIYSGFALYDLGDTKVPATEYHWDSSTDIVLQFNSGIPAFLSYYRATAPGMSITCTGIDPVTLTTDTLLLTLSGGVYTWDKVELPTGDGILLLHLNDEDASLLEFVFTDEAGNIVTPQNASDYQELFDEADLFPARFSFRNSMYFDEIYHARTAKEYLDGAYSYENTHPPLGKIFISLGIALFGMNPFGWRIMGTLFGIAMLPLIYLFAKRLTGLTSLSAGACLAFAFDFMHFTQTRIATIDVFVTFFILAMYYFLFVYFQKDTPDAPLSTVLFPLGLCGISMGLGVACKWTAVYAGMGLGILFFAGFFLKYAECPTSMRKEYKVRSLKTILFCVVFFVLIPAIIYLLSYLPFRDGSQASLFTRMLRNQETMFSYHSTLNATHAFSSPFYSWPFITKPVWYYSGILEGNVREGISAMGNPLVWWAGIPAFLYILYRVLNHRDRKAAFLLVGYFAQYLPWMFISRLTFLYHYFPGVVFVVLMIFYSLSCLREKLPAKVFRSILAMYLTGIILLFLLFYPVLSGQPIDGLFVKEHLRWFEDWILVYI